MVKRSIRHGIACTCAACALAGALNFGDHAAWLPQDFSTHTHLPEPNYAKTINWASNLTPPISGSVTVVSSMFIPPTNP